MLQKLRMRLIYAGFQDRATGIKIAWNSLNQNRIFERPDFRVAARRGTGHLPKIQDAPPCPIGTANGGRVSVVS
jgi:hypothetical protein